MFVLSVTDFEENLKKNSQTTLRGRGARGL